MMMMMATLHRRRRDTARDHVDQVAACVDYACASLGLLGAQGPDRGRVVHVSGCPAAHIGRVVKCRPPPSRSAMLYTGPPYFIRQHRMPHVIEENRCSRRVGLLERGLCLLMGIGIAQTSSNDCMFTATRVSNAALCWKQHRTLLCPHYHHQLSQAASLHLRGKTSAGTCMSSCHPLSMRLCALLCSCFTISSLVSGGGSCRRGWGAAWVGSDMVLEAPQPMLSTSTCGCRLCSRGYRVLYSCPTVSSEQDARTAPLAVVIERHCPVAEKMFHKLQTILARAVRSDR